MLRSSSIHEPSDPPVRLVFVLFFEIIVEKMGGWLPRGMGLIKSTHPQPSTRRTYTLSWLFFTDTDDSMTSAPNQIDTNRKPLGAGSVLSYVIQTYRTYSVPPDLKFHAEALNFLFKLDNDPAAGSPTTTLLRLLPGSSHCDQISFQQTEPPKRPQLTGP